MGAVKDIVISQYLQTEPPEVTSPESLVATQHVDTDHCKYFPDRLPPLGTRYPIRQKHRQTVTPSNPEGKNSRPIPAGLASMLAKQKQAAARRQADSPPVSPSDDRTGSMDRNHPDYWMTVKDGITPGMTTAEFREQSEQGIRDAEKQASRCDAKSGPEEFEPELPMAIMLKNTKHSENDGSQNDKNEVDFQDAGVTTGTTPGHPQLVTADSDNIRGRESGSHTLQDSNTEARIHKMNLLIETSPHMVLPELAGEIGLYESIFLQQLHWLITEKDNVTFHDEELWWRHTHDQWIDRMPYLKNSKRITKIVGNLQKLNLIHVGKFDYEVFGNRGSNAQWYRVNYPAVDQLSRPLIEETRKKKLLKAEAERKKQDDRNSAVDRINTRNTQNGSSSQNGFIRKSQNGDFIYKTKIEEQNTTTAEPEKNSEIQEEKSGSSSGDFENLKMKCMERAVDQIFADNPNLTPDEQTALGNSIDAWQPTHPSVNNATLWLRRGLDSYRKQIPSRMMTTVEKLTDRDWDTPRAISGNVPYKQPG